MDCSLQAPLSTGILQARILEWVAIPSSRGSFQPRDQTRVFDVCCIKMMQGSNPSFWCALHQNVCQNVSVCPHWQAGSLPLASPGKLRDEANHTKVCRVCLFRILASILRVGLNMKYFCVPKWFKDHIEPNELLFIYIHILYVLWFSRDSANPIAPYWLYVSTGAAITECHRLDGLKQKLKKQKKKQETYILKVLEVQVQHQDAARVAFLWGLFLACRWLPSYCILTWLMYVLGVGAREINI